VIFFAIFAGREAKGFAAIAMESDERQAKRGPRS
jgi:hypothetical protein